LKKNDPKTVPTLPVVMVNDLDIKHPLSHA